MINFVVDKFRINPARAGPGHIMIKKSDVGKPKCFMYMPDRLTPATAVSCGMSVSSSLVYATTGKMKKKMIKVIMHKFEWERTVAYVGGAFGHEVLDAQVSNGEMEFSTRAEWNDKSRGGSSPAKRNANISGMLADEPSQSTVVRPKNKAPKPAMPFELDFDSDVPVYDGRDVDLDPKIHFDRMHELPRWDDEVPPGSFVVLGYTIGTYQISGTTSWGVSFNIHWVILVGTPED